MERELLETFEAAKKAADAAAESDGASPEADRCIDALKRLRRTKVTTDVLVSTQVGKRLRYLTKHPNSEIQSNASDLLSFWKSIVIEETSNSKKNSNSNGSTSSETEKSIKSEPKSHKPQPTVKSEKKPDSNHKILKPEKSTSNKPMKEESKPLAIKKPPPVTSGPPKLTSLVRCNDAARDKIRELLAEALSRVYAETAKDDRDEVRNILDEVDSCDPIRVAVTVESALFERLGGSTGAHKHKYRSIMFNLRAENNTDFRRRVLLGLVKPERIVDLRPDEMASDARKQENKQIKEKALFECERGGAPKATTDQFKCGRCGQRKTTYYQLQTRSADEPMTTFVTCVNCNNHWKFC